MRDSKECEGVTAGFDEDLALLGYYCVLTGKQLPTFRRIVVSSFSGSNSPIRSVCYFSWTDSPVVCKHANKVKEQCCERVYATDRSTDRFPDHNEIRVCLGEASLTICVFFFIDAGTRTVAPSLRSFSYVAGYQRVRETFSVERYCIRLLFQSTRVSWKKLSQKVL